MHTQNQYRHFGPKLFEVGKHFETVAATERDVEHCNIPMLFANQLYSFRPGTGLAKGHTQLSEHLFQSAPDDFVIVDCQDPQHGRLLQSG
jgi:hypothetical protein